MKKKLFVILSVLVVVAAAVIYWFLTGRVDETLISQQVSITRVTVGDEKTEFASVSLAFHKDSKKYDYANVLVDLNKDGTFASYQVDGKTQEEWVVQNTLTKVFSAEGNNFSFVLNDSQIEAQKDFNVAIVLSRKNLDQWDGKAIRGSAYQTLTIPSIESDDISDRYEADPEGIRAGGIFLNVLSEPALAAGETPPTAPPVEAQDVQKELEEATKAQLREGLNPLTNTSAPKSTEKTVESLGKEFDVFHDGDMPDITQGKNECVPTSTANSLLWLAQKNKFSDKMPKTGAEIISELKTDLKWSATGVKVEEDYLTGKQAFIERHKLPLATHLVGSKAFDLNIVAKIAQELRKGQDVEIHLVYFQEKADGSWQQSGAHMVTAVGARGARDGQQTIEIHDPLSPGPSKLDIYKVNGSNVKDYKYGKLTYIKQAYAESPVTPPATPPDDSSTPTNATPPTTNSTATPPTPTRTVRPDIETGMTGEYTISQSNDQNLLGIQFTPTRQENVDKKINGVELTLADQNPPLPAAPTEMTAYVNGASGSADWPCTVVSGDGVGRVQCQGDTALALDQENYLNVFFQEEIQQMNPLYLNFLSDGQVISTMNPIAR